MSKDRIKILYILIILVLFSSFWVDRIMANLPLEDRLSGKILLQVEENGEAWYVFPNDQKRYFLGRPKDAFVLMQDLGRGISDDDLRKIQVAEANFSGFDGDDDGLSDNIEKSFGTNLDLIDTDGDGFSDKVEILRAYNPLGNGKYDIDKNISQKLAGFIVLQVEKNGEAWYINPDDFKRYYLGSPENAFTIMRNLGLGISNDNIADIAKVIVAPEFVGLNIEKNQTEIVKNDTGKRRYESLDGYSFEYPSDWRIRKFPDSPHQIQITDAYRDFIVEKKAVVVVHFLQTEDDYEVDTFRIAMNDVSDVDMIADESILVGEKDGFSREFKYNLAHEKTAIIKIAENKFLRISLMTAKKDVDYIAVFDLLVKSLKFND